MNPHNSQRRLGSPLVCAGGKSRSSAFRGTDSSVLSTHRESEQVPGSASTSPVPSAPRHWARARRGLQVASTLLTLRL